MTGCAESVHPATMSVPSVTSSGLSTAMTLMSSLSLISAAYASRCARVGLYTLQ